MAKPETLEPGKAHMVLKGKNDWLFLTNDSNHVIDQMTGQRPLAPEDVEAWRITLMLRRAWLESIGSRYIFAVAPNKEAVFKDHLPDGIRLSDNRPVRQLQSAGIDLIYRPEKFRGAETYSKTDTHWNDLGGQRQAKMLLDACRQQGVEVGPLSAMDIELISQSHYGDLGRKLTPPQESEVILKRVKSRQAKVVFSTKISNTGSILVFEGADKSLPRGMFFADSFGGVGSVSDFIAQGFSRLVVLWQPHFDFRLIEEEKPDIVISQMVERFLTLIPNDVRSEKLSAMSGFAEKWAEAKAAEAKTAEAAGPEKKKAAAAAPKQPSKT
ncbi:hypothetical protein ATO6_22765 [Oceanicola sp. 22II-s10i]|uniref:alginate O-acetyltransferase AlgX-related protein n=1 Tax=Oceanicola sp. 22II-s10i TaxID=1317116 RepID=UPI000B52573D|nr:hypothetical protein [Oceanicola sp. 22II-s10i]OWU82266.1 hypothetical protein ATO6_22765 [Oceanicola sp. 22II-s10i]